MQCTSHDSLSQEATGRYVLPNYGVIQERGQYRSQEAKGISKIINREGKYHTNTWAAALMIKPRLE